MSESPRSAGGWISNPCLPGTLMNPDKVTGKVCHSFVSEGPWTSYLLIKENANTIKALKALK